MALVAVLQSPFHTHQHDHVVHMGLLDPDDMAMALNIEGMFRTAPSIESKYGEPGVVPLAVPIHGLQFPIPGKYTFIVNVDGAQLASYPIHAVQVATIPVPQGPSSTPSE